MENIESAVKRPKISAFVIIMASILIIAIATGIYFLFIAKGKTEPRRGTYVLYRNVSETYAGENASIIIADAASPFSCVWGGDMA